MTSKTGNTKKDWEYTMKSFEHKGKQYTTGIYESYGWAYPCVYEEKSFLFFKWKERVYTQDGIMWPYHVAANSRPDQIEYHDTQVEWGFKNHMQAWEGKENPFRSEK